MATGFWGWPIDRTGHVNWFDYYGIQILPTQPDVVTPSAPSPTPISQTFPTSAYGQTIPVLYGKGRVPGGYIWALPLKATLTGDFVSVFISARLRFARPLVANSNWRVRRVWSNGRLIWDRTTGLRDPLIEYFREYDGQNSQARDPLQVEEEGETAVSAGRGYLDIVIKMDLGAKADAPPTFDAEWIQDPETGVEVDNFASFVSNPINTFAALSGGATWFGISDDSLPMLLRRFNSSLIHEVSSVPISNLGRSYNGVDEQSLRYIPTTNRLIALMAPVGGWPHYAVLLNANTGAIVAESDDEVSPFPGTDPIQNTCCINFSGGASVYLCTTTLENLTVFRSTANTVQRTFQSGYSWRGYTDIRCIAPGEIVNDRATVWVCADNKLVKLTVRSSGAISSVAEFGTFTDDLVYVVEHDGDPIVWTDPTA